MKKTLLSVLAAAALPAALHAAEMGFEGRWLLDGHPQASVDSTCEVRFYDAEDASAPVATATAVPFRTDADGYFVVSADVPAEMPDAFWAGVAPAGGAEIVPRMCVAPVPYALAAAEAALVTNDIQLVLTGSATVERLVVAGNARVDRWTIPPDGTVKAKNLQTSSARLVGVSTRPNAALGLFAADGGRISADYDALEGESFGVEVTKADTLSGNRSKVHKQSLAFDRDGFLLVALKTDCSYSDVTPEATLVVGGTTIVDELHVPAVTTGGSGGTTKRFLCVPVRAGEKAEVSIRANGVLESNIFSPTQWKYKTSRIDAKVRFVPFGRE